MSSAAKVLFFPLKCKSRDLKNLRKHSIKAKAAVLEYTYGIQYHTCTWQ